MAFSAAAGAIQRSVLASRPGGPPVERPLSVGQPSPLSQLQLLGAAAAAATPVAAVAFGRTRRRARAWRSATRALATTVPPAPPASVEIAPDAAAVGRELCMAVANAAHEAVGERGAFALAIPGGSILNMLAAGASELADVDWGNCTMAYVNHRCVSNDDDTATHKKALNLFLSGWTGISVITVSGSRDGPQEANKYEEALKALPESVLPRNSEGLPVFDLTLIGVGDDGHFGSLYPGRGEIADESGRWVLSVDKKSPPSITLSPATMLASKKIIVASAGVSEKYPQGKSLAMRTAVEGPEGPQEFPAAVLRGCATYLFDVPAASELSLEYRK